MKIQPIIDRLKAAKGKDRGLDGQIAQVLGVRKKTSIIIDEKTGTPRTNFIWLAATSDDPVRIPTYTASIDAARELSLLLCSSEIGGFAWADGEFTARMEGGPLCSAATPALALCVACLSYHLQAS